MKTKQIIIALCLIAGFGLLVFFWQQSRTNPEPTSVKTEQTPAKTEPMPPVGNNSSAPAEAPGPPIDLGAVSVGGAQTPTEAYKMLFAAVKAKNTDAIKRMMSQKTLGFAEGVSAQQNTSLPKFYENGLTATTFAATLPKTRDERVKGDMGALEVWNEKDNRWEDLPFVKEADGWKLAIGDIFAGTHQSPGKGQAQIESEASNTSAISNGTDPIGNSSTAKPEAPRKSNK